METKLVLHPDIKAKVKAKEDEKWFYTDTVRDHFFNPRNLIKGPEEAEKWTKEADGVGMIGAASCGDMMKLWVNVDKKNDKIVECKFQTFGCGSAISSTSMFSVMVTENGGMKINDALKLKPQDIIKRLENLPTKKYHCSVLCDKAFRDAVNDYFRKSGQINRIVVEGARIIDPTTKTTDKDIEEAVLEGALTFDEVQKKLKVAVSNKALVPAVEQLIKFYREKYFG